MKRKEQTTSTTMSFTNVALTGVQQSWDHKFSTSCVVPDATHPSGFYLSNYPCNGNNIWKQTADGQIVNPVNNKPFGNNANYRVDFTQLGDCKWRQGGAASITDANAPRTCATTDVYQDPIYNGMCMTNHNFGDQILMCAKKA